MYPRGCGRPSIVTEEHELEVHNKNPWTWTWTCMLIFISSVYTIFISSNYVLIMMKNATTDEDLILFVKLYNTRY